MHILLYLIAFLSAIIGIAIGYQQEALNYISSGLLAGILFGSLGKIVHLLDQMEEHLRAMRQSQLGDAAGGTGGDNRRTGARG